MLHQWHNVPVLLDVRALTAYTSYNGVNIVIAITIAINPPDHDMPERVQFQFLWVIPFGKLIYPILVLLVLLPRTTGPGQMSRGNANGYVPPPGHRQLYP